MDWSSRKLGALGERLALFKPLYPCESTTYPSGLGAWIIQQPLETILPAPMFFDLPINHSHSTSEFILAACLWFLLVPFGALVPGSDDPAGQGSYFISPVCYSHNERRHNDIRKSDT